MFLKLFKGARPALLFFIPIFAFLLWAKTLFVGYSPDLSFEPNPMPLYTLVTSWIGEYTLLSKLLALVILILMALWLSRINTRFIISGSRTYLPTFLYLIIVSGYLPLQQMNPGIIAGIFLIYCLEIMFENHKKEGLALRFFQAAFLVSISSLFYARSAFMLMIVWAGLSLLRPFRWREWVFTILGFFLPYLFLFSLYYLAGFSLREKWEPIIANFQPVRYSGTLDIYYLAFYGFIVLMLIAASFRVLGRFQGFKIYLRKFFRLNLRVFLLILLVYWLLYSRAVEFIYLLAVPVTYILTYYLYHLRSRWTGEVITGILLALYGLILVFH